MSLRRDSIATGPQSVAISGDVTGSMILTGDVHIHLTAATAPNRPEFKCYLRMLAVVAAPVVGRIEADPPPVPLDLWAEWRRLEEAIRNAWDVVRGQGTPWAVVRLNPPTRAALADALAAGALESAYQVVHFSGHGAPNGLDLEDDLGRTNFVTDDELVDLFRDRSVRLIVLNACKTEAIARRLHEEAGVSALIATTDSLRDDEAHLLTARLYAWLARGRSVAEAFVQALSALCHAYERGELPIPPDQAANPKAYIAARLAVPILLGDAQLTLPPVEERAKEPFITLAEPPSRGMELRLIGGFVGRGPELVQIARWLRDRPSPVIALSGLGGIGKSALAAMAALRGLWRFQAVVALSARDNPHLRPDDLVPPLEGLLGKSGELASAPTEAERLALVVAALNKVPTLLVLDNLEDLTETATRTWADFLGHLDPRCGSVALLTLRPAVKHPLTDLAGPAHLPLERLAEPDALRLLADGLADRTLWDKVPSLDELTMSQRQRLETMAHRAYLTKLPLGYLAALDDLAGRAGCHPLMLRLALGDLRYPYVDWAKALTNVSDLRGRDQEAQAEETVGQMVDDLARAAPEAVVLLQALLVFQGGATYEALRMVAAPDADEAAFDDHLRAALDSSLLEGRGSVVAARYDVHPFTRTYLKRQRAPAPAMLMELRRRHAMYFAEWAQYYQYDKERIVGELSNLKIACTFLPNAGGSFDESLVGLAFTLRPALEDSGYWGDLASILEAAQQACARMGDNAKRAKLIAILAQMYTNQSAYESALHWAQKAVDLAQQIGELGTLAEAHLRMGWVCLYLAKFTEALEHLQQCKVLAKQTEQLRLLVDSLHFMGRVYAEKGDFEQALSCFRAELQSPQEARSPGSWAYTWLRGAGIVLGMGKIKLAKRLVLRSKRQFQALELKGGVAQSLRWLARISLNEGSAEGALRLLTQSLQWIGYRRGEMNVRQDMVEVYIQLGYLDEASKLIDEVIQYRKASKERKRLAEALYLKGRVSESLGNLEEALKFYEESLDLFEAIECLPSVSGKSHSAINRLKSTPS